MNTSNRTKTTSSLSARILAGSIAALLAAPAAQADTFVWDSSNVTGTPPAILDWFTGGANPLGLWTGVVVPVSDPTTIIKFFADTTTSLPNTNGALVTQTVNLNNGGSAFQLGTLELNGFGSTTSGALLTMTLQGDALNFSGATGTISFNSRKNTAPGTDPVINYNVNNNIQLGTLSSASALTINGNGDGSSPSTTSYIIGGNISELQSGGGSGILKSGSSAVTISGTINISGPVTVGAGTLTLSNNTISTSAMTVNGGTLILTGNLNPASASMTVNSGGILRIGNNTATQFGPAGVYSGDISTGTGGTLQLWSTATQTLSGIISGSGGINKAYGGTLTLSGSNTYTGQSVFTPQTTAGFTVNVSSFDYVSSGTWANHGLGSSLGAPTTIANGTINVGSTGAQAGVNLTYTGAAALGETTDRVINLLFNGTSSQTITANNASGVLRFTSAFTSSTGTSGKLILGGTGAGQIDLGLPQLPTGGLEKIAAGTWTLGGSGAFTGQTLITAGTLRLSSATALQNSPFTTTSVAGGAAAGLRIDTTTLTLGGLTGANALRGRFTTALGGPSSATAQGGYDGLTNLTLNTAGGSTNIYTGAIAEGATGMSLTKTGAGIQTLNTVHTYTGTTFVNGGFLQLNGNTLTGGLSVSNGHFASNSTFAGVSTVGSGGVISPGATSGAIGAITLTNATASALTLDGSTGIFDLPSTVTTPDQIVVTGGLVVTNTNTVLLRTSVTGTPIGVYNLITSSALSGAGPLVLANGSATRGNATVSTSGNNVILTVAGGALAGTTTYTGTSGAFNSERWNTTTNWNSGAVPTGTTSVFLPDQTSAFNIPVFNAATPTYSGDLWIGNNVTLQIGSTTGNAANNNALGTPGSTIIYMGQNSAINSRNSGFNPTLPQIILLGDASMRFQESTQVAVNPNFANSISGAFTLTLNSGAGNGFSTHTLNAANSFAGLNLAGTSGVVNAAVSGSIGTADLTISGGGTVNLNHATAISDGTNAIRINNGTLTYGTTPAAALTLSTRPIELNGTGNATINNSNTLSSNANILTLGGGISSTAAGAKTLTLGGANTGVNRITGNIIDGTAGTIALTKADGGTWGLSGTNTYSGNTNLLAAASSRLVFQGSQSLSPNTKLIVAQNSGSVGNVRFLDDAAGTINFNRPIEFDGSASGGAATLAIFVGNNNTTNQGSSSGTTTGSTIQVGNITHTLSNSTLSSLSINATSPDSYRLRTGTLTLNNLTARTAADTVTTILNPTSANMTVDAITMATGNITASDGIPVVRLDGTASDNIVTGAITNATDFATGHALSVQKQNTSIWVLSGTGSNYSGTTAITGGTLAGIGTNAFGNTTGISIAAANTSTLSLRGDTDTEFKRASDSVRYALTTTANGATINVDHATIADTGSQTMTIGTLALNNAATNGTNFTGANNTSLSIGAVTTSAAAGGTETLTNNIASTGSLTLASIAVARTGTPTLAFAGTGNTTVTGNITGTAATALTKSGAGTLTLSGTNSYTGTTTVNASGGTLEVATGGSLSGTTGVTVNTGGTLLLNSTASEIVNDSATVAMTGGTLGFGNAANQTETLGAMTLTVNSILDFGASGGADKFLFAGFTHTAGVGTLTINNWLGNYGGGTDGTDDRLVFNGDFNTFISAYDQADVSFGGFGSGYAAIDFGGTSYEIVPVPEPATTALIGSVALCALIGYRERRRFTRKPGSKTA